MGRIPTIPFTFAAGGASLSSGPPIHPPGGRNPERFPGGFLT
jgi:hypothetical protein